MVHFVQAAYLRCFLRSAIQQAGVRLAPFVAVLNQDGALPFITASMTATQTLTLSEKQSSTGQSLPPFVTSGRTRTAEPSHTSKKRKRSELGAANGGTMAPRTPVDHDGSPSEESARNAQTDSAEVLSHAAARKRRKQGAKTANLEVAQDGVPPIPTQKNTSGVRRKDKSISTKRQNSVWVGNLSFQTTQANVKRFFQFVGEVTRIHMPMKSDGGNRGYGVR